MSNSMTPREIEAALKDGMTTAAVNDNGTRATIILRPKNSSRTFQMVLRIEEVTEL
ncbi:MAG: hypothetical protein HOV97_05965 [Nonomuraea sp.]|nr:hypothetical protein [Nonomuraea sp.]